MVGWHHWLNGHEFEQTLGDGEGQGNLACCSPQGHKRVRHDLTTEQQKQAYKEMADLLGHLALFSVSSLKVYKLALAQTPSGRVLYCLWGSVLLNPWMVFSWIRDVKLMTKLYYFCHLTVWTPNLQKIQREVPYLAPGKCYGIQKSDIIYDYSNQSRYHPAESTRLGPRGCHVSMRTPGSSGQVSIAKLISKALNSYLYANSFKALFK